MKEQRRKDVIYVADNFFKYYKDERDIQIVKSIWLKEKDFVSLAKNYNLSVARIRELYNRGLRKLKKNLTYWMIEFINLKNLLKENASLKDENNQLKDYIKRNCGHGKGKPIKNIKMSKRTFDFLRCLDIVYIGEICDFEERDLYLFRNVGVKTVNEIKEILNKYGFKLKERNEQNT